MATGVQVWSGTPVTNATVDSNVNWAEGMAPSQVNDSSRAAMASVAKWRDDNNTSLITSGTSAALTLVTNQVEAALTAGYTVAVTLGTAVDAAATLAVDGLGAVPIQIVKGTNISAGQLSSGATIQLVYSSTGTGQWIAIDTPPNIVPGAPNSPAGGLLSPTPPTVMALAAAKMMGLGATAVVVPKVTGRCSVSFSLNGSNSVVSQCHAQIYYGTGTAPSSGAAVTGTLVGINQGNTPSAISLIYNLNPSAIITGITVGTTYWLDMAFTNASGTFTSSACQFLYQEF